MLPAAAAETACGLSTKNTYNHGLFILDLAHMPGGACGTWPAFWMLGPDWPNNGEIDILEGVNSQTLNSMAMHTDDGCSITSTGAFSGNMQTDDCNTYATDQATNAGCAIDSQDSKSYGNGFNSNGGGVYATEWTSEAISIWFFTRDAIPSDIASGNPDPSNWGLPQGQFTGNCNIDDHVKDQQLVFDVTFCGDWAGAVWSTDATCSTQASTCQDYVQNTPSAFQDTYWLINSLKVYTDNGASSSQTATSSAVTASQTATATSTYGSGLPTITTFVTITSSAYSTAGVSTESTYNTASTTYETSSSIYTYTPSSAPTTYTTYTASYTSQYTTESAPTTFTTYTASYTSQYTPSSAPTTYATPTASYTSQSVTESATITTAPSPTATWSSSAEAWNTWSNGGGWGGNGNGNPQGNGGNGGNGNGGGWGGHGGGGGWKRNI